MNEYTVTIPVEEYNKIIRKAERLAVIERMANSGYISTEDIRRIIGTEGE